MNSFLDMSCDGGHPPRGWQTDPNGRNRIPGSILQLVRRLSLAMLFCISCFAFAEASSLVSYYFSENEQCTLILDFQPNRAELSQLSKEARSLVLAKELLGDFRAHGPEKCPDAKTIRLLAVFVPGVDNYGRPEFGSRINLLRLEGSKEKVLESAERDFTTTEQIGGLLTMTVF